MIIEDLNHIVRERSSIVLADGQFLTRPIAPDWDIAKYFDDETSTPYDHPSRHLGAPLRGRALVLRTKPRSESRPMRASIPVAGTARVC